MSKAEKVNKSIRGASRSAKREPSNRRSTWLLVAARNLLILTALGGGGYVAVLWTVSQLDRPVASVKINGEFSRVVREDVAKQVYDAMGNSFVRLDLERIQRQLENMAWVDSAKLARAWPDGLNVTIIEHKPIARWGEHDALNHRGEVIALDDGDDSRALLAGLPILEGAEGMERQVMDQYQTLTKVLADHGLSIRRLRCDLGRSWSMELGEGVQVNIGRDQVMDRVSRFLVVFETQLQQRWAELSTVDLRYFNGVAVKWRSPQANDETATKS